MTLRLKSGPKLQGFIEKHLVLREITGLTDDGTPILGRVLGTDGACEVSLDTQGLPIWVGLDGTPYASLDIEDVRDGRAIPLSIPAASDLELVEEALDDLRTATQRLERPCSASTSAATAYNAQMARMHLTKAIQALEMIVSAAFKSDVK